MDPALVGAIVAVIVAIFASITAPIVLQMRLEKQHREDRADDWERRTKDREADWAHQDAIAAKAAKELKTSNGRIAEAVEVTNGKLDVVHTLVNSNMTTAMQAEYDAVTRELAMMREVMELKQAAGGAPSPEALAAIKATEQQLKELAEALGDRAKPAEKLPDSEAGNEEP
jgi:hypothetical protein